LTGDTLALEVAALSSSGRHNRCGTSRYSWETDGSEATIGEFFGSGKDGDTVQGFAPSNSAFFFIAGFRIGAFGYSEARLAIAAAGTDFAFENGNLCDKI
jgi:hypothetical protein